MAEEAPRNLISFREKLKRQAVAGRKLYAKAEKTRIENKPEELKPIAIARYQQQVVLAKASYEAMHEVLSSAETDEAKCEEDEEALVEFQDSMDSTSDILEELQCMKQLASSVRALTNQVEVCKEMHDEDPTLHATNHLKIMADYADKLQQSLNHVNLDPGHPLAVEAATIYKLATRLQSTLCKTSAERVELAERDVKPSTIDSLGNIKFTHTAPPQFSGNLKDWTGFWEEFIPIHETKKYTTQDKLKLLKDAMQDKSLKMQIANGISQGLSYLQVVEELQSQFDNPRAQHKVCLDRLWEMKPMSATRSSMLNTVNEVQRIITGLTKLGQYDAQSIFTTIVEELLPPELFEKWSDITMTDKLVPPIDKLLKFIKTRAVMTMYSKPGAAHPAEQKKAQVRPKPSKPKGAYSATSHPVAASPTESTPAVPVSQTPKSLGVNKYPPCRYQCLMCAEKHFPYNCQVFKDKSVTQRQAFVTEKSLCVKCLRDGHTLDNCKSRHNCHKCQGLHNTLLHVPSAESSTQPLQAASHIICAEEVVQQSSHVVIEEEPVNALTRKKISATCMAKATGPNGKTVPVRVFLDNGSEISSVTTKVAKQLQLKYGEEEMAVTGFASTDKTVCRTANMTLTSYQDENWSLNLATTVTDYITRTLPAEDVSSARSREAVQVDALADPTFDVPGDIQVLVGQAAYPYVVKSSRQAGSLMILDTVFGDAILGSMPRDSLTQTRGNQSSHHVTAVTEPKLDNRDHILNNTIEKFWKMEQPLIEASAFTPEELQVQEEYKATHKFIEQEGRYQVTLPRKTQRKELGESRSTAMKRYLSNERSLQRKGKLDEFQKEVKSYLDLQHARLLTTEELKIPVSQSYYMPMHGVEKQSSTTTKLRVVFDASCKTTSGASLNDTLAVGPLLHPSLEEILIRFRSYRVALNGDISKMYREILLDPLDQQYHRFLWRSKPGGEIRDYCMRRVTFGVASSPYVAVRTLQQACQDFGQESPLARKHIYSSFYVDDLLGGADTEEEALEVYRQVDFVLRKAGFTLRKIRSSSEWLLSHIPNDLKESSQKKELVDCHSTSYNKALGVVWDHPDVMKTDVGKPYNFVPTKRGVLSDVAKTFDVMGWITPVILPMKLLIQELWRSKKGWDDPISTEQAGKHKLWREELSLLEEISIPRCYFEQEQATDIQVHGFCDASLVAYGTVIYVRAEYANAPPTCRLVMAKSKVAPLNTRTIAELELCAAVLLTTVVKSVCKALSIPLEKVTAWGDSEVVLCWLRKCPADYKTFVANRIATITRTLPASQWKHVSTTMNSADCASRGCSAAEFKQDPLWWTAPPWLSAVSDEPDQPREEELNKHQNQLRKEVCLTANCNLVTSTPSDWLVRRTMSLRTLIHVTARVRRAAYNFSATLKKHPLNKDELLSVEELKESTLFLLQRAQRRAYPAEVKGLLSTPPVKIPENNKLIHLAPFLHNELLRVGGRLRKSRLDFNQSHPILLSVKDPLTKTIFLSKHMAMGHCGATLLLATVGTEYFVVGAKRLAQSICKECVTCRKISARSEQQLMADLPTDRITEHPAFNSVGIDYAGPFLLKTSKLRTSPKIKVWLAVFICFATKGVHLEIVSAQTTEAFVATMNRFVSRRGMPKHIYSDNGTNFIGAKKELENFYKWMDASGVTTSLQSFFSDHKATWHCSPQRAPHFGGLWEAAVKAAKHHMKRIVGPQTLTFEEMNTVFVQIEACLNSRPLLEQQSHNTDGIQPITPAHLLIGKALKAYPEKDIDPKMTCRGRWILCQHMVQCFWKRWSSEYLVLLQRRNKWTRTQPNLGVGDIVLMKDGSDFKTHWALARVTKIFPGDDDLVRTVEVKACKVQLPPTGPALKPHQMKVKCSTLRRPVSKLALLVKNEGISSSGGECSVEMSPSGHGMQSNSIQISTD